MSGHEKWIDFALRDLDGAIFSQRANEKRPKRFQQWFTDFFADSSFLPFAQKQRRSKDLKGLDWQFCDRLICFHNMF
jgi:hypothetical protein